MERFEDPLGLPFRFYAILRRNERVAVKCPKCNGLAHISQGEQGVVVNCTACFHQEKAPEAYRYTASGMCTVCERWFNEEVTDHKQQTHKAVHIACPHCAAVNQVPIRKLAAYSGCCLDFRNERDPIFQLELYYLDYFRGKPVWAANREHLNYLISYISAELREKPAAVIKRTASHSLPKYMKEAKNREAIVKLLHKLQRIDM
ncbi:hypothetical protein [Paenibacillus alvei]|uniref:Uncharacterized protein n=1 Tax=Paenibacillus alvei TaxID=44250 RepID=A0A383REG2_PAEAL|nr:hypothetical protein [Paenibacillus alvei]SYX85061.1 conserved protein of unknown function [Paenibacillus alvei]